MDMDEISKVSSRSRRPAAAAKVMELPTRPSSGSSSAAYPQWVLLRQEDSPMAYYLNEDFPSLKVDAQTMVTGRTSAGDKIQLFLDLVEPPTVSSVVCQLADGCDPTCFTIAAHRDSILIKVCTEQRTPSNWHMMLHSYSRTKTDLFVYNAGAAAADPPRLPSLTLLPPCYHTISDGLLSYLRVGIPYSISGDREAHPATTGMLRRGEDDIVVAELVMGEARRIITRENKIMELLLFRSGEWSLINRPQIRYYGNRDLGDDKLASLWSTDTVVPVTDRLICWVDLSRGLLLLDVFEETPSLQFVPLPMDPCYGKASHRNVCATAGGTALVFVNIFPRCCCGGQGATATGCDRSRNAYTINTWTMRVSDDMEYHWVKDGTVHNTDLWGLDAYKSLPRLIPSYPVVSLDEPQTITFLVNDDGYDRWLMMVDMKSKTLRLVTQNFGGGFVWERLHLGYTLVPSSLSCYLNSRPSCISSDVTSTGQSHSDTEMVMVDGNILTTAQSSCCESSAEPAAVEASEILAVLQEIPTYGLDDRMLKAAYRILSQGDNGQRFRSLARLPTNLRKDWLLMEIKAREAG